MAIAYARPQVISRATGRSVVACAAYRAAEKLHDDRQDKTHRYEGRSGVLNTGILTPTGAPEWMRDREQLWNAVERREDRSNRPAEAQLAREVVIALPHELDDQSREFLLKNILKEGATRKGMVADYAIHAPDREGDNRNYHAHVLLTMRAVDPADPDGFGKKVREWNDKAELAAFKKIVERETNKMLERHGSNERISFDAPDREKQNHLGHAAQELERRGISTEAGDFNRGVEARNAERDALRKERDNIERELATLDRAERVATMSETSRDIVTGIAEAFGKNLERGEFGERFGDYLKEQGLQLERDKAGKLHVSDGQKAVALETVISDKDKREVLPVLEQPVTLALIPERKEPEPPTPEEIKQQRATARAKLVQEIGKAWQTADRNAFQLAINLGDIGLTLATTPGRNYAAVDEKGWAYLLSSRALGEDARKVEQELRQTFREHGVTLPTVEEVQRELKAERTAQWKAQKAEERRARYEEQKAVRLEERAARLAKNPIVQEIGRAWASSDTGPAFVKALEEKDLLLARVTRAEALISQHQQEATKSHGHFAPAYEAGQYVAITKQGHVFALDRATLHDSPESIEAKLKQIDGPKQLTLTQAKEVMAFWRGELDATPYQPTGPSVLSTAKTMAGRVGHGIGGVMNIGERGLNGLVGVLDYLFGMASPQQPEREGPGRSAGGGTRPAMMTRERYELRKMDHTNLTQPLTKEFIKNNEGRADADLLADLRRQIEEAKKREKEKRRDWER